MEKHQQKWLKNIQLTSKKRRKNINKNDEWDKLGIKNAADSNKETLYVGSGIWVKSVLSKIFKEKNKRNK